MKQKVQKLIARTIDACVAEGLLPPLEGEVLIDVPKNPAHGDFSCNAAMLLSKAAKKPPRAVAELLLAHLRDDERIVTRTEIAGPGFINLFIAPRVVLAALGEALAAGKAYGRSKVGAGEKVMVEYVSANPTGPMHVGHGRGAVVGDALATLLKAAGFEVTREYYINDAGGQVKQLGRALYLRYREQCGHPIESLDALPYPGEYLVPPARKLKAEIGETKLEASVEEQGGFFTDYAMVEMLEMIRQDLKALNIEFDSWYSERQLHQKKAIDQALEALQKTGHLYRGVLPPPKDAVHGEDYEPREQLLFKSTDFGDDQDRPLQKPDGAYTYFAADIAYHKDKLDRGFDRLIDVWGADHGGYVRRVKAAVEALTGRKALDVLLVQMVNLIKGGQPYKMSKRAGTFVTLRDLVDEAGVDATRVMFLMKRADSQLEFDLDLVKKQTMENPVFYVQYGHARCANIFKRAKEAGFEMPAFDLELVTANLTHPDELELVKRLTAFPSVVEGAALAREPHRLVFYIQETSAAFQSFYTKGKREPGLRVVQPTEPAKTNARLLLIEGLRLVFANALTLLGVSAPEWMEVPETEAAEAE